MGLSRHYLKISVYGKKWDKKAKEYVHVNYTWENVTKKTIEVYENVLNGSRDR